MKHIFLIVMLICCFQQISQSKDKELGKLLVKVMDVYDQIDNAHFTCKTIKTDYLDEKSTEFYSCYFRKISSRYTQYVLAFDYGSGHLVSKKNRIQFNPLLEKPIDTFAIDKNGLPFLNRKLDKTPFVTFRKNTTLQNLLAYYIIKPTSLEEITSEGRALYKVTVNLENWNEEYLIDPSTLLIERIKIIYTNKAYSDFKIEERIFSYLQVNSDQYAADAKYTSQELKHFARYVKRANLKARDARKKPSRNYDSPLEYIFLDMNHDTFKLAVIHTKVILLDYWNYGCRPCIEAIPFLNKLQEKYEDELLLLSVNCASTNPNRLAEHNRQHNSSLTSVMDHFNTFNDQQQLSWPLFVFIDTQNNSKTTIAGYCKAYEQRMEQTIIDILKKDK